MSLDTVLRTCDASSLATLRLARLAHGELATELTWLGHPAGWTPPDRAWVDAVAYECGDGGTAVVADHPLVPLAVDADVVVLPDDAGRAERAAVLTAAAAYVAGPRRLDAFAAAEALACGTPVVARAGTAAADLVDHGRTGVVVECDGEIAPAVRLAAGLDRWACRKAALDRFSVERVALDVVAAGRPSPVGPAATERPTPHPRASDRHGRTLVPA